MNKQLKLFSMICGFLGALFLPCSFGAYAANLPLAVFPLDHYSQQVDDWLPPSDPDYKTPLLSKAYQQARLADFHRHVFSTANDGLSPWSAHFVESTIRHHTTVFDAQKDAITAYGNVHKSESKRGYGENFRPYPDTWIEQIADNMDIAQFAKPLRFTEKNRAIIVQNAAARMLPTYEPHFYSYEIPGEGYPFDNLQASALWVGTPVYILGQTKDRAWSLIMTPSYVAWVETTAMARVSPGFAQRWQKQARTKLAAITRTKAPIIDNQNKQLRFSAYVGTVLPAFSAKHGKQKIWIPLKDVNGYAYAREALVSTQDAKIMPILATRENFAMLFKTLQNRPYGWGGLYFLNDCSAEMQSLFTAFGIWLPRNSAAQRNAGYVVDKSAEPMDNRIAYLMANGHPLFTTVYIGGHVFLYLGNFQNPHSPREQMAMTYQNMWGLRPFDQSQRWVIGQAVFLPLLTQFPEQPQLGSQANTKLFQIVYYDRWPDSALPPYHFVLAQPSS